MLILTRRVGETFMIGDDITITICSIRNSQARIGIEAPRDVSIHRKEVYDRIIEEQQARNDTDTNISKIPMRSGKDAG